MQITIRADQVQSGDLIWSGDRRPHPRVGRLAFHGDCWIRVSTVEPTLVAAVLEGEIVVNVPGVKISTMSWDTFKVGGEGIAVLRHLPKQD